ncbi:MAG: hypothetical protein JWP36_911 [Paucimonas sp.]|nr:hypothetical protein [Paucimonas sp.]
MNLPRLFAILALACAAAACGGGGGDIFPRLPNAATPNANGATAASADPAPFEGFYAGTLGGLEMRTLVLDNAEFWVLNGQSDTAGVFNIVGLAHGQAQASAGNISGAALDNALRAGSLVGTYTGVTLNGTLTTSLASGSFTSLRLTNGTYVYGRQAQLGDILGAWNVRDLAGNPAVLDVGTTGQFTLRNGPCTSTGTLSPRLAPRNVFDATMTTGIGCSNPGTSLRGHAFQLALIGSFRTQLILMLTNDATVMSVIAGGR